jgi:hypothetical protein
MRRRALLVVTALGLIAAGAACGTTGGDTKTQASSTIAPTTSTPTSEDTTDELPSSVDEADLGQVLPQASDLPAGFTEASAPGNANPSTYAPGPGCERLAEYYRSPESKHAVDRQFSNAQGMLVTVRIGLASQKRRAAFKGIGKLMEACTQIKATVDTTIDDAIVHGSAVDLGDDGFAADLDITREDTSKGTKIDFGLDLIAVLHGGVAFKVVVFDGSDSTGLRIPRDPALAQTLAAEVDQKLGRLLGD